MYMKDSKRRLTLVKESGAQNRNESAWNMGESVWSGPRRREADTKFWWRAVILNTSDGR